MLVILTIAIVQIQILVEVKDKFSLEVSQLMALHHELKMPLQTLLNLCYLLKNTPLNDQQLELIHQMEETVVLSGNIIQDWDKPSTQDQVEVFSISTLVHQLTAVVASKAKQKKLQLTISIAPSLPTYWQGHPTKLLRILVNLLDNAIKYTHQGSISLQIEATDKLNEILFCVQDTGIGMSATLLEKVLNPFERFSNDIEGEGIGLHMVDHLVTQLNGSIHINSNNNGTKIEVLLPLQLSQIDELTISSKSNNSLKILLVDDHEIHCTMTKQILERHLDWVDIIIAKNGAEAIEILKRQAVALVLLDIQMPILDGEATAQRIRAQVSRMLPIIAMTGNEIMDKHLFTNYLVKPFKPETLIEMVTYYVKQNFMNKTQNIPKLIDLSYLDLMADGDELLKKLMLEMLLDEFPAEIQKMQELYKLESWRELRGVSHRMKTTLSFIGNEPLSDVNCQVEYAVKHQIDLENLPPLFEEISRLAPDILLQLEAAYEELVSPEPLP